MYVRLFFVVCASILKTNTNTCCVCTHILDYRMYKYYSHTQLYNTYRYVALYTITCFICPPIQFIVKRLCFLFVVCKPVNKVLMYECVCVCMFDIISIFILCFVCRRFMQTSSLKFISFVL